MQVLLTHAVPHFGQPGDLVKVRPGFARNYLLPQGLATFATPHNLRIVEKHRQRLRELEEARRADLVNLAAQIAQRSLTIEANANAEGHLYGSVNADQIAAALRGRQLPDRRRERQDRRARSRNWASTPSSSTSARTSTPRSSSGSSRPTPRKPAELSPSRPDRRTGWPATDARPVIVSAIAIRRIADQLRHESAGHSSMADRRRTRRYDCSDTADRVRDQRSRSYG